VIGQPETAKSCCAIVPAAGLSSRMGPLGETSGSKCLLEIEAKTILQMTLEALVQSEAIGVVVVLYPSQLSDQVATQYQAITSCFDNVDLVPGGDSRQESVSLGLNYLQDKGQIENFDFILVHDAARALVSRDLIRRCIKEAYSKQAVTAAIPVVDSIKRADSAGVVTKSLLREGLWMIQTPQVFRTDLLIAAHAQFTGSPATDDAALVEPLHPVSIVPGERSNIKITTPEDLLLARHYVDYAG